MISTNTPYYAVIFTSTKNTDLTGYKDTAEKIFTLTAQQPGFIGLETSQTKEGHDVTICYWQTEDDIKNWKANTAHLEAQKLGQEKWYSTYRVRICKVERDYSM